MKLDLGIVRFEVSNDDPLIPSMVIAVGQYDAQESVGPVGPTLAKSAPAAFRRTLSIALEPLEDNETEAQALTRGIKEATTRTKGQPGAVTDRSYGGVPAKVVEFSCVGPKKIPLVTFALIVPYGGFLQMIFYTALRDKKNDKAVRKQFDMVLSTFGPGSFFDDLKKKT